MTEYSLYTSLPVRKIVKGDTLSVFFTTNGVALFQGVNPDTGVPTPSWNAESGPVITPHVGSARGASYSLEAHRWKYNGNDLKFSTSGSGWETSTVDNRFQINHTDGSIRIIGDLASKNNQDADTLEYSGVARQSAKVTFDVQKTVDIFISPLGSSSFGGGVSVESTAIGTINGVLVNSTHISNTVLFNANGAVASYTVKVRKGLNGTEIASLSNGKISTFEITRDMVDGQELFIVEFYIDGNTEAVYRTGFTVIDIDDLYQAQADMDGEPSDNKDDVAYIKGKIINVRTHTEVGASGNVVFQLVNNSDESVLISKTVPYQEFHDTGIPVTGADITDAHGNTISASANMQFNVTIA
mgnify:FL=1